MAVSSYLLFQQLHQEPAPLLLPNAWDARSAAVCQASGFRAVATSSAAIAAALGYADGEQMPFPELLRVVRSVCGATTLPVTVDVEAGYSREVEQVGRHLEQLHELGVVGINIEDAWGAVRELAPVAVFARFVEQLKTYCLRQGFELFFNVRTDTYLRPSAEPAADTVERIRAYEAAGADGIFIPGLTELEQIRTFAASTRLPLNVMCLPHLPDFAALAAAGVKRISMGNFLFEHLAQRQGQLLVAVQQQGSFKPLF